MPQDILDGDGNKVGERLFPIGDPFQPWDFMTPEDAAQFADGDWTTDGAGLHDGSDATYFHGSHTVSGGLNAWVGVEVERASEVIESIDAVYLHTRQKNTNSSSATKPEMYLELHDWPLPLTDEDTPSGREPWGLSQFDPNGPWFRQFTAQLLFVPANDASIPGDGVTYNTDSQMVPYNGVGFGDPSTDASNAAMWTEHLSKSDVYRSNALAVGSLGGTFLDPSFDSESWLYEFWIDVYYTAQQITVPRRRIFGRNDLSVFPNRTPQQGLRPGAWSAL